MAQPLSFAQHGDVAELTLDRPDVHNAFDNVLITELTETLQRLDTDTSIRAVILTGRGHTFSAGADLHWMRSMIGASAEANREDSLHLAKLMRTLNFLSKPTVARVNGSAYGGGVGLLTCCDIAIGVEGAKFALTEVKLGLVPAVISPYVLAAIGVRQARRLFLSGEIIDATEAARIGLLHQVVAGDELDAAIDRQLHWLHKGGPIAQHVAKRLAIGVAGSTPETAARIDAANAKLIAQLRVSEEGQEGLSAFLDKHPPHWAKH